ncbi:MAG: homocysteine S-methyltransferase family protein [Actinobacteria bacterium]|nr:homocysteine S-methyltransferase family protein [Actinomycetota bacterium]
MRKLEDKIRSGVTLLDGATGTMLSRYLSPGELPDMLLLRDPSKVSELHRAYLDVGSEIIETDSFGSNAIRLGVDVGDPIVRRLNMKAAEVAVEAADSRAYVGGSIGPLGKIIEPLGEISYDEALRAFNEQALALVRGGVDLIVIETMTDLQEARIAIAAVKEVCNLPIFASMSFDESLRTMMGVKPADAARELHEAGAFVVGANCGVGSDVAFKVMEEMIEGSPGLRYFVQPNAGMPRLVDGRTVYEETPEQMAHYAKKFVSVNVTVIGACCGSTPEHIRAIKDAVYSA